MCENSHAHNLGRQEPKGCRYIYGDPAIAESWHYCQRTMAPGAKLGDALRPPYCPHHTRVCVQPAKAFKYYGGWEKDVLIRLLNPDDLPAVAADVFLQINRAGAFSHD